MYGGGANPPIAGGIVGGGLAATGANLTWPIIIIAFSIAIGALLLVREAWLRKQLRAGN